VVARQLARDRLDLRDLLRGENGAGDPRAVGPASPRGAPAGIVFATWRRPPAPCPAGGRSRRWSSRRPRRARSALAAPLETGRQSARHCLKLAPLILGELDRIGTAARHASHIDPRDITPSRSRANFRPTALSLPCSTPRYQKEGTALSFQTPITIQKVLERISARDYVLPAIQREFVWDRDQICALFDSLMRKWPDPGGSVRCL
jgi:hypothetical protein